MSERAPERWVEVAIDVPVDTAFTYAVPHGLAEIATRGCRVLVPFRNRSRTGVVLRQLEEKPKTRFALRPIADVLDASPVVPDPQLEVLEWAARYYHQPVGEVVALALPGEAKLASSRWVEATDAAPSAADEEAGRAGALALALRHAARPLRPEDALQLVAGARHHDLDTAESSGWGARPTATKEGVSP